MTRDQFRGFTADLSLQESATLRKNAESRSPQGSTFLSHSSKDDDIVTGATRILENHGARVYIDKKDQNLPPYTNKETASALRKRINQSNKFVILASNNSKESKWVPWELGIADGYKGNDGIALFPAVENKNEIAWTSWEYLGLYDRIVWGKIRGRDRPLWMVLNREEFSALPLSDWLAR
jgi:hypothetical protein